MEVGDEILAPPNLTSGMESSNVYNLFQTASKHRPILFEIKCKYKPPTNKTKILLPICNSLHLFTIKKSCPLGIKLEIENSGIVQIKVVTPDSLGDIYGLRENNILCKPLENGALGKVIPNLSKCSLPLVIEVWRALPTSTEDCITLMKMPGLNSSMIENPFMFTFPQDEPSTTWPTSPPIMDCSPDGSNGSPRRSPRGKKKPAEDCNSIQDGRNNIDDKVEDLDNCNDDVNNIKNDKDDSDYIDDVDNDDSSGMHKREEDGEEETEVAKEKSNRKRKTNKERSRKKKSTTEITLEENAEMNVKENGEENKNVEVHIKGKVATIVDLFTGERKTSKWMESVTRVGLQ
jgi:hypothetical protein